MAISNVPESKILKELRTLDRGRWQEVIDFIIALKKHAAPKGRTGTQTLAADALLNSGLER